jgi:hypothetical protein
MSQLNVNQIVDASGGVLAPISSVMRNRLINSAMVIDQRNAGASLTSPSSSFYALDRFNLFASQASKFTVQQNAGSVTPPAGFKNYLGITSSSAYTVGASELFVVGQAIEGFNTSDLDFGTANAKTVTLSFWVRSSLTGTFGGSLLNSAQNRSYPFSYTISAANTWEQKSLTIAGDTTGTWLGATNGVGLFVYLSIGTGSSLSGTAGAWTGSGLFSATGATSVVGTNGATFYITGVQLEVGTQATSFEYRQYQQELALCQRYFNSSFPLGTAPVDGASSGNLSCMSTYTSSNSWSAWMQFPVTMRAQPTVVAYRSSGLGVTNGLWGYYIGGWFSFTSQAIGTNTTGFNVQGNSSAAFAAPSAYIIGGHYTASAEL